MPNDKTGVGSGEVDGGDGGSSQGLLSPDALLELLSFLPHPEVRYLMKVEQRLKKFKQRSLP